MNCHNCGINIPPESEFCPKCGQPIINNGFSDSSNDKRPYFEVMPEYKQSNNKFPVKGVIAIILVIILIALVFAFMMLKPGVQKINGLKVYKPGMFIQEKDKNYTVLYKQIGGDIVEGVIVGKANASDFMDYMSKLSEDEDIYCSLVEEKEINNHDWFYLKCEENYVTDYFYATNNNGKLYFVSLFVSNTKISELENVQKNVEKHLDFYE